ncbi:hypothetical protein LguiB_002119 [Lonicera macranthoides]
MPDYLPQELQQEILSRLPIQSLLQFRCVSKSWNSLITSPNFITTHLNRTLASNSNQANTRTLLRHYSLTHEKEIFSFRFDTNDTDTFDACQHLKCPLRRNYGYYFSIIGSCNGLLCLTDDIFEYTNNVFLWNPSIRRYLKLPVPRVTMDTELHKYLMCVYGFGVDPNTNDYKVVRISYTKKHKECYFAPEVELYKLNTHSWIDLPWEEVRGVLPPFGIGEHLWSRAFMNGKVHWIGYKQNCSSSCSYRASICCFVLLFDMGNDVFSELQLPESLVYVVPLNLTVALMGESLSVLQCDEYLHSRVCTVWIMKEYGIVESWSKLCTIDLGGILMRTIGLRKNGDFLLAVDEDLFSYNPNNHHIKNLGLQSSSPAFFVAGYVDSLVLLEEGHRVPMDPENSADELEDDEDFYFDGLAQQRRENEIQGCILRVLILLLSYVDEFSLLPL